MYMFNAPDASKQELPCTDTDKCVHYQLNAHKPVQDRVLYTNSQGRMLLLTTEVYYLL